MRRKQIIFLILNIPLSFIVFTSLGWLLHFVFHDNPTFIIPFNILIIIFFVVNIMITIGAINSLKIYSEKTVWIALLEVTSLYFLFWSLL